MNFQTLLHHNERVQLGDNGRTAYRLPEPFGTGYTYYWRVRAVDGANTGPYSHTSSFSVVNKVLIEAPIAARTRGQVDEQQADLPRAQRPIEYTDAYYRFEVANGAQHQRDDGGDHRVARIERRNDDDARRPCLRDDVYWRVHGTDGTTQSEYSPILSFTTPQRTGGAATTFAGAHQSPDRGGGTGRRTIRRRASACPSRTASRSCRRSPISTHSSVQLVPGTRRHVAVHGHRSSIRCARPTRATAMAGSAASSATRCIDVVDLQLECRSRRRARATFTPSTSLAATAGRIRRQSGTTRSRAAGRARRHGPAAAGSERRTQNEEARPRLARRADIESDRATDHITLRRRSSVIAAFFCPA